MLFDQLENFRSKLLLVLVFRTDEGIDDFDKIDFCMFRYLLNQFDEQPPITFGLLHYVFLVKSVRGEAEGVRIHPFKLHPRLVLVIFHNGFF